MKAEVVDIKQFKLEADHKVWVYVASRPLSDSEQAELIKAGKDFLVSWNAHGATIKGDIHVLINQVVLVTADQSYSLNSGCSIDKLLRFVQSMEQAMDVQLLNRMLVPIGIENDWTVVETRTLKGLNIEWTNAQIMNVMVSDSDSFNASFVQNAKDSWIGNYIA